MVTTRFFLTNLVFCRSQLGPDLQIVVLDMALDDQIERVKKRHKGEESAIEMCKVGIANVLTINQISVSGRL